MSARWAGALSLGRSGGRVGRLVGVGGGWAGGGGVGVGVVVSGGVREKRRRAGRWGGGGGVAEQHLVARAGKDGLEVGEEGGFAGADEVGAGAGRGG